MKACDCGLTAEDMDRQRREWERLQAEDDERRRNDPNEAARLEAIAAYFSHDEGEMKGTDLD